MRDPRCAQLARVIVHHSTRLQAGETALIEAFDFADGLILDLIDEVHAVGGIPVVQLRNQAVQRLMLSRATEAQLRMTAEVEMFQMQKVDAYVGIRGAVNSAEMSDIPGDQLGKVMGHMRPIQDHRVNHTKWVVLRYPTASMAQLADMSTERFEDFYFRVCTFDYGKMSEAMDPLKQRMERTDRVHLKGPGTDLRFSIKGISAIKCEGRRNLPDGECYTAPVRDSVEGTIQYNTPSLYLGTTFENIRFTFAGGKIVKAEASQQKRLDEILDSDEGARFIGEFSLGFNPYITKPMKDTLFDEKIAGSLHFTPGQAYTIADNGNRSKVHWDLVLIQTPEYGGGEVWFDGELVRKDGRFVVSELEGLNPDRLKS